MIQSFEVENFRAFLDLKLSGLPSVNILVGQSASGKTALLEAIRMALGATPTVAWQLNAVRGVAFGMPLNPPREQFEAAWSSYFFDFDIAKTISFRVTDSDKREARLEMYFDKDRPVTPTPHTMPGVPILTSTIIPLAFKRQTFTGEINTIDATISPQQHGQIFLQQGSEIGTVSEFFPSTWQSNSQQVAAWFSQLRISNQAEDIFKIVHKQFPDITEISSEVPYQFGALYATIRHHSKKMPISLISSGINKFVSLLIAIRTYRGGVILVDEIENGIYYKMFPAFWEALHRFAVENKTQLFLSTHSWECLKAAATVIDKHTNDFALIQVSQEKGISTARIAAGENAAAAIESDIEVRK
jgi:AAA15 family ATPase/GTPase